MAKDKEFTRQCCFYLMLFSFFSHFIILLEETGQLVCEKDFFLKRWHIAVLANM